jgi:hypothetical protein
MIEYVLTLNSEQARETLKAVELLMRLKLNQPEGISRAVLDGMYERIGSDEFCKRRDVADMYIKFAFRAIFPRWGEEKKDTEWYRLYNLYQVLRKAIHDAENPNGNGVDSHKPIQFTEEPLPKIEWKKKSTMTKEEAMKEYTDE